MTIVIVLSMIAILYWATHDTRSKSYRFDNYKVNIFKGNFIYDVEAVVYKKHHLFATYHFNYNYGDFATPAEMAKDAVVKADRAEADKNKAIAREKEFWGN